MSQDKHVLSRRRWFAGAGVAGAVAAGATLLPRGEEIAAQQPESLKEPPEKGGGYQLSEHVKRYYRTTLV